MAFDFPDQPITGTVYNPAPGIVYTYNGLSWDYTLFARSQVEIMSLYPDSARVGNPDVIVRAEGAGFTDNTQVVFDGVPMNTRLVSQTVVSFRIDPVGDTPGVVPVTIQDANIPGIGSVDFEFLPALPVVLDSLQPEFVACGGPDTTLTVMGNVFHSNCVIKFDGVIVPQTDFQGYNTLETLLTPSVELTPRTVQVTVNDTVNDSNPLPLKYVITPIVTSVTPVDVYASAGPTLMTITGSNFTTDSEVMIYGVAYVTTFVSATQLQATFTATQGLTAQWPVFVRMGQVASNIVYINVNP